MGRKISRVVLALVLLFTLSEQRGQASLPDLFYPELFIPVGPPGRKQENQNKNESTGFSSHHYLGGLRKL